MKRCSDVIEGTRIMLVPYLKEHVPLYHSWLSDPEMQTLTGTDPTTLQEEYEYQKDWDSSNDRITKLIEVDGVLIGDINLFKNNQLNSDCMWEVNIMIVKEEHRGHGYASEALELVLKEHHINNVMAKVHKDNQASINFFRKHFQQITDEPDVFGNITFVRTDGTSL
jgi:RimJ/RimL family protein N-acetyltransferase